MMAESDGSYDRLYIPRDGVYFDPDDPDPEKMSVGSIAHGLATEFRYGGHTEPLINVAQHSVDTAKLLEEHGYDSEIQFYGLHHDSAEAYLGDEQKPNKELMPAREELEDIWQEAIWDFLEVDPPTPGQKSAVKDVDFMLYLFESEKLFENDQHRREAGARIDESQLAGQMSLEDVDDVVDLDQMYQESKNEFLEMHEDLITKI